jgi:formate dehydrogenase beta subunit
MPTSKKHRFRRALKMTVKVDAQVCVACEACVPYCPMEVISIREGTAVIDEEECVECCLCQQAQKVPGLFKAPCSHFCPAGIDVPRYVQFIADGKPAEALAVIREKIPFPAICGLVCFHPCEARCARGRLDEPIAIRMLKRYAWEHDDGSWKDKMKKAPPSGKKIAVIGSGPAGLTAAFYLTGFGHQVTVFEALPKAGGMMLHGIPEYRLPKEVIRLEIKEIKDTGVEIRTNSPVASIEKLRKEGYDAVFIATGAHRGLRLGIPGEDSPRVMKGIDFLKQVRLGKAVNVGKKVAIIGGGNSAVDSARTALRLGAREAVVFYRRSQTEMPATREEIEEALNEGVEFHCLAAPIRVISRNGVAEVEFVRTELGMLDDSGRRRPMPVKGSEFTMRFDTVIAAIGQKPEIPRQFNVSLGTGNVIKVNPETLATSLKGVFAGGDVISGPASIIEAIASGRKAALSIERYLGGKGSIHQILAEQREAAAILREPEKKQRITLPALSAEQRLEDFNQVELSYSDQMATEEAKRCLRCDVRKLDCIIFAPSDWPRSLRNHFSQPAVPHENTGVAGRGTEEMKTNDVTGRFKRGWVGLGLDVGRPGIGARFRDVDILTQTLAKLGVEFETKNPVTKMMVDTRTGKLREDILNEKIMSCVVEAVFPMEKLEEVLSALREATKRINTVVSVCNINRAEPDGSYSLKKKLEQLGILYYINGKQNCGLGRPIADV